MSKGIAGRTALVTGGGDGIGRACAVGLAKAGAAQVAITYRGDADGAAATARLIEKAGASAHVLRCDLAEPDAPAALATAVTDALGPVQLLVNNAAYTRMIRPDRLTTSLWRAQFRVNVDAVFELTWALREQMIKAGGGAVVNISSTSARRPDPMMIAYGASKAALEAFTLAAGLSFAREGVRMNAVAPGFTKTPRVDTVDDATQQVMLKGVPMGRMGLPEEVAAAVVFLLSDAASYMTGQVVTVAGGL